MSVISMEMFQKKLPSPEMLERGRFTATPRGGAKDVDLLTEAQKKLGYRPKALSQEQSVIDQITAECEVQMALDRAGVHPFDPRSVQLYKTAMERQVTKEGSSRFVMNMHGRHGGDIVTATCIAGVILTIGSAVATTISMDTYHGYVMHWIRMVTFIAAAVWIAHTLLMYARHKYAFTREAIWTRTLIKDYQKPIPEFAIATALAVAKELPGAGFAVDELDYKDRNIEVYQNPRPSRRDYDPFLVMTYKGIQTFLEVWNEPTFAGERAK